MSDVTQLLSAMDAGDPKAADQLLPLVYGELRKLAVVRMANEKGERWMEFRDRYGDWGRDVALWLGRTAGRMRLQELAGRVGGVDYTAAGAAVGRLRRGLAAGASYRDPVQRIKARLSNIWIRPFFRQN